MLRESRDRRVKKKPRRKSKKLRSKCRMQKKGSKMLTGEKPKLRRKDWLRRHKEELSLTINSCSVPNPKIILGKMDHCKVQKSKTSRQNSQ